MLFWTCSIQASLRCGTVPHNFPGSPFSMFALTSRVEGFGLRNHDKHFICVHFISFYFISSFRINESYDSYVWPLPFHLKQQSVGCTVMTLQVITVCNSLWSDCAQDTSELISQFLRRKPHVWAALLRHSLRLSPDLGEFSQVTRVEFLASLGIISVGATFKCGKDIFLVGWLVVGYCIRPEYHTWHSQTKKFHKELGTQPSNNHVRPLLHISPGLWKCFFDLSKLTGARFDECLIEVLSKCLKYITSVLCWNYIVS